MDLKRVFSSSVNEGGVAAEEPDPERSPPVDDEEACPPRAELEAGLDGPLSVAAAAFRPDEEVDEGPEPDADRAGIGVAHSSF